MTLVEIAVVVLLLAIFATAVAIRFDALATYRQNGELRTFLNTWQFLLNEAAVDGNSYRFIIDLDTNSYLIRQEIPLPPEAAQKVDLNRGLRLKSEKERKKKLEDELALTPEQAFEIIDEDEKRKTLEEIYASTVYADPGRNTVLSQPVNFPSLGDEQFFSGSLKLKGVKVDGNQIEQGRVALHFTPQGASNIAVIQFDIDGQIKSALLNPLSGESKMLSGDEERIFIERGAMRAPN